MKTAFNSLNLPERSLKPRETGLTMILDKNLNLSGLRDILELSSNFIDIIKLGWGTSAILNRELIKKKCQICQDYDISICPGGTLGEVFFLQNKIDSFFKEAKDLGFSCIEISNGTVQIPEADKLELIRKAKELGFLVISEVGSKISIEDRRLTVSDRIKHTKAELEAGAWKVIIEARESGTLGIYDDEGIIQMDMMNSMSANLNFDDIIFEAPLKSQQVELIKHFGNKVNLGNINPSDVISLETLRMGLRGDTLRDFHLVSTKVTFELGVRGALAAAQREDLIVIIDALRASTTIITAIAMGVDSVKPVTAAEDCIGEVTAGERGGHKIESLMYDNSPISFFTNLHKGKKLTLTTTNGTECIRAALSKGKNIVLIGSLINSRAVSEACIKIAKSHGKNISLIIAGRNGAEAIEDVISASEIALAMKGVIIESQIEMINSSDFVIDFLNSDSGKNLTKLGKPNDVIFCAQKDKFDVVPIFINNAIIDLKRTKFGLENAN